MRSRVNLSALLLGMLLIFVTSPAAAQSAYPDLSAPPVMDSFGTDDVALVVAIDEYAFLPDVTGARRNAADWEVYFRRGMGLSEVFVLTNEDATREDILDFADRAASLTEPGATLWFVFIGHGAPAQDGRDGVMVGMDARGNVRSLQSRGVAQQELIARFEKGAQERTVMIVDACFSGVTPAGESLAPGSQPVIPVVAAPTSSQLVLLSAARADQVAGALPGEPRPAFSYLLLGALHGWAADSGEVTASQAIDFVARQLRGVSGRQQTPQLFGAADFVLSRATSEEVPDIAALIARQGQPEPKESPKPQEQPNQRAEADKPSDDPAFEPLSIESPKDSPARRGVAATLTGAGMVLSGAALLGYGYYLRHDTLQRLDSGDPTMTAIAAHDAQRRANNAATASALLLSAGLMVGTVGIAQWAHSHQQRQPSLQLHLSREPALSLTYRW